MRWLRLGRGRWYTEAGKWGVVVRLNAIHFTLHFDPAEED